jgi:ribosomal protein L7/L12
MKPTMAKTPPAGQLVKDPEPTIAHLRAEGFSKIDSIKELRNRLGIPLGDAKEFVHYSPTWADRRKSDDEFHKLVIRTFTTEEERNGRDNGRS